MTRPAATLLLAAALAGGAGCRTGGAARLRVDPPPAEPGAAADAQALRLERAVREVAAAERLACRPGAGAVILACSPGDVGTRAAQATIELVRAGAGYELTLVDPLAFPGRAEALCALQRRLARAVDAELGMPLARVDPRSRCRE